ncbi:ABC transporter permease [Dongia deserti]|uniref:ABC transporter permease n=1 Tax=Dongia deserti TaxID=2268030 RepID=UPI000E65A87B|nr:ABC transporter permease [Dongia deserti]
MSVWRGLLRRPLAMAGLVIAVALVAVAIAAPLIAPYSPYEQFFDGLTLEGAPLPPNERFLFGTDLLGRDLLSRMIYGARTSLIVGLLANGIAVLVGTAVGITAGFLRGVVGAVLMRFTDLVMAFPALILAITIATLRGPSLGLVVLVIALVNWGPIARVVYAETTSLAEREFIAAERAIGANTSRILFRHILPHLLPIIIVWGTLGISTTVLFEALLSYLGVGVQPPNPSWGNIVYDGQSYFQSAPWLVFFPGFAVAALALSINLIGDALRDLLDPTLRGRH